MKKRIITTLATLSIIFLTVGIITAQEKMDHNKMDDAANKSCCSATDKDSDSCMDKNKSHYMQSVDIKIIDKMDMSKVSIIHEGEIDLLAIDKNGDKKVFQDQMDWNVISDEPGNCPICEMKLKEVSIYQAKYNLIKNGFKVKDFSEQK